MERHQSSAEESCQLSEEHNKAAKIFGQIF
jgi:hypothetical protein